MSLKIAHIGAQHPKALRVDKDAALCHNIDRGEQHFVGEQIFAQIATRTNCQTLHHRFRGIVGCQYQNGGWWLRWQDALHGGQSGEKGHVEVHQYDIGFETLAKRNSFGTVAGCAYYVYRTFILE